MTGLLPAARLAMTAGAAAHHGFELAAGAGLMLQREAGLPAALGLWGMAFTRLARAAAASDPRAEPVLRLATGASLAAVVVHYTLWPWRTWHGLPVLSSAEGLAPGHLPAYNTVLVGWGMASATAAVARAPRRRAHLWTVAGFVAAVPLRRHARRHFAWVGEQANAHPAWWNRARW